MIIEGAFLKLPELLISSGDSPQYEATLASHLAMGVLQELSGRNIEMPMRRLHIEKQYPSKVGSRAPGRADLYVDLSGIYTRGIGYDLYGMKPDNWIEAKYFGGIGRQQGSQAKTENAASIALDLLRLCLFVREERTRSRDQGRYAVLLFNRDPSQYLAFSRQSRSSRRRWLEALLVPGTYEGTILLEEEPPTFRRTFGQSFGKGYRHLSLTMRAVIREFSPIASPSEYLYWGYLIRITHFELVIDDLALTYADDTEEVWSEESEKVQAQMTEGFSLQID